MHYLFAQLRSEHLLAQANGLRREVDKLVLSYVFEGVFQGHLAQQLLERKVLTIGEVALPVRGQCHKDRRVTLTPL